MRKTLLIGALLFLGFAVAFAPAGLIRLVFDEVDGVMLTHPVGTIWDGQGQIVVQDSLLGTLQWDLHPTAVLKGALGYDFSFRPAAGEGTGRQLAGSANMGFNRSFALTVSGTVPAELVNRFLAPYDMAIEGDLELTETALEVRGGVPSSADGQIAWAGGTVRYILSGRYLTSVLPPLVGYLGEGPEGTVFAQGGQTPLIRAELLDNGFAKVGITKQLTKMLGNPWPGSDADHAVVLEVEEQVF